MRNCCLRFLAMSAVIVLVSLCPFQRLHAQLGVATLSGSVTDPSGAFVPNAQVTLQSSTEKASRQVSTDSGGGYFIVAIVPGTYELEARPERRFLQNRASETKGLWFDKSPKTLFPDGPLAYLCLLKCNQSMHYMTRTLSSSLMLGSAWVTHPII